MMGTKADRIKRSLRGLAIPALALALLAGCHKQEAAPTADDFPNEVTEAPPAPTETQRVPEEAPPLAAPPRDVNVAEALPPEEAPSRDAQMVEDADATGLTARTAAPDVVFDPPADPMAGPPANGLGGVN